MSTTTRRAVCDNRYCPDWGLIVPAPDPRRCRVCGWLMRLIDGREGPSPSATGDGPPAGEGSP